MVALGDQGDRFEGIENQEDKLWCHKMLAKAVEADLCERVQVNVSQEGCAGGAAKSGGFAGRGEG